MRLSRLLLALAAMAALTAAPAGASFPDRIPLPDGWQPEGIAVGRGTTFYAGSLRDGAIYRGDLRTGSGAVLVPGREGGVAVGLAVDQRERLFVAGGPTGGVRVHAADGSLLAAHDLGGGFVNDVVLTRDAAWFTDSFVPVLYRLPIGRDGRLGSPSKVPLQGDLTYVQGFNANGIEATPDGRRLLVVQSNTGRLFTIDPATGVSRRIDLRGEAVPNGDGLLLAGRTLYVVQNRSNAVAVVELSGDLATGSVTRRLTSPAFDVPTTAARHGDHLYLVNARFGTPPTSSTSYDVVRIRR